MTEPATSAFFCARCGTRRGGSGACERDGSELVAVTPSSLLGTEVGHYVLVQRLGEGGMGAVYRAVQPQIGAEVAIKVLHASPGEQAQRFLLEAQAVNRVRHRNLISIIDTGYLSDRRPYLVMELLDGVSLADVVGAISPPLAARVAAEVLDALEAVHREGIVHRDLKPPNVFLASDGRVVVLDFGIAKLVDGEVVTHSSGLIGTPEYMAPEQIRAQPIDRRTDLYAVGVMLYETITGRRPFSAAATFDMLVQHLERPPTSPREFAPNLSPALADVILRAMEKQPDARFQSAADMAAAVRETQPATRDDLIAFVAQRDHTRPPVPMQSRPAESATANERPSAPREREASPIKDEAPPTRRDSPGDRSAWRASDLPAPVPGAREMPRGSAARTLRAFAPHLAIAAVLAVVAIWVITRTPDAPPARPTPPPPAPVPQQAVTATPIDAAAPARDAASDGAVEITSNPSNAALTIDHLPQGKTPVTVVLRAGAHLLHAELAGHVSIDEALEVRAGEHSSVMLALPERGKPTATTHVPTTKTSDDDLMTPKGNDHSPPDTSGTGSAGRRKPNPFQP